MSLWDGWGDDTSAPQEKGVYTKDEALLGLSAASTAPDLLAPGLWGGSMATGTLGSFSVAASSLPSQSNAEFDGHEGYASQNSTLGMGGSNLAGYPRIITCMNLLEESDDESTWCGPPSEDGYGSASEQRSMEALGIGNPEEEDQKPEKDARQRRRERRRERDREGGGAVAAMAAAAAAAAASTANAPVRDQAEARERERERPPREPREPKERSKRESGQSGPRQAQPLIHPQGDVEGDNQKFICVFQIGLEDDEEFCLVKRILGKAGNNMRRIAEECSSKVRLRGIGSGFLEGADGKEANMPLQLNVSCTDFDSYQGAVDRVATLLKDLYKHYRRYSRSKGVEPPDVKVSLEEVRRDDIGLDLLQQKAQRSPSQRERDRRAREKERQMAREKEREKERERTEREGAKPPPRKRSRERFADRNRDRDHDEGDAESRGLTLPGGAPIPTTPAGRRLAARAGGAEHAAIVSAAAREAEKSERDRVRRERQDHVEKERDDRDNKKREAAQRAAAVASRVGRNTGRNLREAQEAGSWANFSSTTASKDRYSSPQRKVDAPDGAWSSWKGNTWEDWDPWADKKKVSNSYDSKEKGSKDTGSRYSYQDEDPWMKEDPWANTSSKAKGSESSGSKGKGKSRRR